MRSPHVSSYDVAKEYVSVSYRAVLLDNITSAGPIGYEYVICVVNKDEQPIMFMTSERIDGSSDDSDRAHFLCKFASNSSHVNYGKDKNYGDRDIFESEAIKHIETTLNEEFKLSTG